MVVIVGGGLAGLACAKVLHHAGVQFQLIEAGASLGGRLATTVTPDGFHLDHGFQVLLDNYPAVHRHLNLSKLDPGYFDSGAMLVDGEKHARILHPVRHPSGIWESAFGSYGTLQDRLLLTKLAAELLLARPEKLLAQDRLRLSTHAFLERRGFSSLIMESFLRPFFGGVLLDNELTTSASLFQYYFQKFIRGRTLLPSRGIREIPLQIASHLPASCIKLNSTVAKIGSNHVELRDGGKIAAEHIVLATPAPETARLLERNPPAPPRRVSVCYFTSPEALYEEKLLVLPRGKDRLVRHYAQVTNVAPKLAPRGSHLLSATILDRRSLEDVRLLQHAKAEIAESFPSAQTLLTPLRVIDVPYGVPAQLPRYSLQRESGSLPTNVSLAGDHTTHGSIQGALQSGEEAAQSILKRL